MTLIFFCIFCKFSYNKYRYKKLLLKVKSMTIKQFFTTEQAKETAEKLNVNWSKFDVEQFRLGMDVELEHGTVDPNTNVTNDDPLLTGKITLAHLNEIPDYYTRLYIMEEEAEGK